MTMPGWRRWCEHIPPPKLWPCAVGYSSGSPPQINPRMCRWLPRWTVSVIRSADGVSAILRTASPACKMRRARVGRGAFPPSERVDVLSIATKKPATYHCPATLWSLGQTRTSADWATHLMHVVQQLPAMQRYDWVVDNLNTHWSLAVCRLVAHWCHVPYRPQALQRGAARRAFLSDPTHQHVFHFTPKHGSWLNQVELWFSVLARRFLKRGDFASAHDFETRLGDYMEIY